MRILILLVILSWSTAFASENKSVRFRVGHYNIKELDVVKLTSVSCQSFFSLDQVITAAQILKESEPDVLSINEIHYDLPGVPSQEFQTRGENLSRLLKVSQLEDLNHTSFDPANTGMKAKKDQNGNYVRKPKSGQTDKFADPVNFGLFPGQYSTGAASRFPIIKKVEIHKLSMKDFDPKFDPTKYSQKDGTPLPEDIELFDKNFTHLVIDIQGRPVHFVFLHTVPAHHFGNPNSINPMRNKMQLSFLEWYLSGKTDHEVPKDFPYAPIPKGEPFVALGDWNVDPSDSNPGAQHILNLDKKFQFWLPLGEITYRSQSFAPKEFTRQFDYILLGPGVRNIESGLFRPESKRIERGCGKKPSTKVPNGFVRVSYTNEMKLTCYVDVDKQFARSKVGSDHILLWTELEVDAE